MYLLHYSSHRGIFLLIFVDVIVLVLLLLLQVNLAIFLSDFSLFLTNFLLFLSDCLLFLSGFILFLNIGCLPLGESWRADSCCSWVFLAILELFLAVLEWFLGILERILVVLEWTHPILEHLLAVSRRILAKFCCSSVFFNVVISLLWCLLFSSILVLQHWKSHFHQAGQPKLHTVEISVPTGTTRTWFDRLCGWISSMSTRALAWLYWKS